MRKLFLSLCFLLPLSYISAQNELNDLSFYADVLLHAEEVQHREIAHEQFLQLIQEKLQQDSNFQDSFTLNRIPLLYAPDSSFRIISWQLHKGEQSKTFGFVQKRGASDLILLKDRSEYLLKQEFGFLYPDRWLGAVYTSIEAVPGRDSLYLLNGYNRIDPYSILYVLDILNLKGSELKFGSPIFENETKESVHRRIYEVAAGANFRLEIADSLQRIVSAHLTSVPFERNSDIMVNVPDGTYEVLEWNGLQWIYKERLFEQRFQDVPTENVPKRKEERDIFGREQN